jgi:plastocyanin
MNAVKKLTLLAALVALPYASAVAADYTIIIKDHKFTPAELKLPAGEKHKLIVKNEDATPEEFESHDMKREKIVAGNSQITVNVGPLKAGTYKYFGEFNQATAQGVIIAE